MSDSKDMKIPASIAENTVLAKDKRGFPFKKVLFGLIIAVMVISLILLVVNLVVNSYFSKVTVFDGVWELDTVRMYIMPMYRNNVKYFEQSEALHEASDKVLLNYAQASSTIKKDENVFNYAIFGTDQFDESSEGSADIIMMASVNKSTNKVTYLAFETKMLVYIPGVGIGPLSDAYILGGPQLLANTISQNYGIQVDGFVELNMTAFIEIIDTYGTIDFKADAEFVEELNADIDSFNESKGLTGDNATKKVKLEKNMVHLDGKQTLAYLRSAGEEKSAVANSIISQLTKMIFEKGFGGVKQTLDIALEETTVSLVRDDVGALIRIGISVLGSIDSVPVGNMEGKTFIKEANGYVCDYQAERAAILQELYCE